MSRVRGGWEGGGCLTSRGPRTDVHIIQHPPPTPPQKQHLTCRREDSPHTPRRPRACFQRGAGVPLPPPLHQQLLRGLNPAPAGPGKAGKWGIGGTRELHVSCPLLYFRCVRDYCRGQDIRGERRTHRSLLSFFSLCLRHKTAFCSPFFFSSSFTRVNGQRLGRLITWPRFT